MKRFVLLIFTVFSFSAFCQDTTEGILPEIEIQFDESNAPYIAYEMKKGATLYNASRTYGVSINAILNYNKLNDPADIPLGTTLYIPFDMDAVFKGEEIKGYKSTRFAPVIYKAKKGETLFRIAKVYAGQSIDLVKKRNNLLNNNISIDQAILLGWLPSDAGSRILYTVETENNDEKSLTENEPLQEDKEMNPSPEENEMELNYTVLFPEEESLVPDSIDRIKEKGIAIWTKTSKGHSRYVLHPTAKLNSEIELYNPIVNRSVRAKVIGRIPEGAYKSDVSVIISPSTAVSLGALDQRFKVEMTYVR